MNKTELQSGDIFCYRYRGGWEYAIFGEQGRYTVIGNEHDCALFLGHGCIFRWQNREEVAEQWPDHFYIVIWPRGKRGENNVPVIKKTCETSDLIFRDAQKSKELYGRLY